MRAKAAVALATVAIACLLCALNSAPALALSKHVFSTSFTGSAETPTTYPTELAIDQSTGDLYVAEPGHSAVQQIAVNATGGTYNLTFRGQTTGARGDGTYSATTGHGNLFGGTEEITGVSTAAGAFAAGQKIEGKGIPRNTYIREVGTSTLLLDRLTTASGTGVALTAGSGEVTGLSTSVGTFVEGEQISGEGITDGTTISEVHASTLTLSQLPTMSASDVALVAAIPYGASAGVVEEALCALPTIGPHNVEVNDTGEQSYLLEFEGPFTDRSVPEVTADPSGLTGAASTVTVSTIDEGRGPDVQKFSPTGQLILIFGGRVNKGKVAEAEEPGNPHHITEAEEGVCHSGEECQPGSRGSTPGFFDAVLSGGFFEGHRFGRTENRLFLALDDSPGGEGDVYVGDPADNLITKFDSSGRIIGTWGEHGPNGEPNGQLAGREGSEGSLASGGLSGLGVGRDGTLFALGGGQLFRFAQNGTFIVSDRNSPGATRMIPGPGEDLFFDLTKVEPTSELPKEIFRPTEQLLTEHGVPRYKSVGSIPGNDSGVSYDPLNRTLYATVEGAVSQFSPACVAELESCAPIETFGAAQLSSPQGVAVDYATGTVYVADYAHRRIAVFSPQPFLPEAPPPSAEGKSTTDETLRGEVDPAGGGEIKGCKFEYAPESAFEGEEPPRWSVATTLVCSPSAPYSGPSPKEVGAEATGLTYGTAYRLRLSAENAAGATVSFTTRFDSLPLPPEVGSETAYEIFGESVKIRSQINPGGGDTTYRVEYVAEEEFGKTGFAHAQLSPSLDGGSAGTPQSLSSQLSGLTPGITYRYRVIARNANSTAQGNTETFTTLSAAPVTDPCPNAHVRQQTSAAGLLDCRAYELVSAANAGGYDVTSNLVEGQEPFAGYPQAAGRVLYSVQGGGIPGTNHPTDRGSDPYVASRTERGWSTEYVGIPANATPSAQPFSSTPLEADAELDTFAFGGEEVCSPCFADGSTGIPVHLPSGELVEGMAGSKPQPEAAPAGYIAKHLSANGEHLLFGATSPFEPKGEEGSISIYDRNLKTEETSVASKLPASDENIPCELNCTSDGIGALAVSADGSHVLIGQLVSESAGQKRWHLFMRVGDSLTEEIASSALEGVAYAGMTEDGSRVFFTSEEHLTHQDEAHTGASLYVWEEATASLKLISRGEKEEAGQPGDTGACEPAANSVHPHWNSVENVKDCGIVSIGGGGGVAVKDGSAYFLSPELLAGSEEPRDGTKNAPNLYIAAPSDGYAPRFVATLESQLVEPNLKPTRTFLQRFGSFLHAAGLAVDRQTHDIYVLDIEANTVQRFDSSGRSVPFTAGAGAGTNTLSGAESPAGSFQEYVPYGLPTQMAVDNSEGPNKGDLYVPDLLHSCVDRFSSTGKYEGQVSSTLPSGVAVNPENGDVYVAELFSGTVSVFESSAFTKPKPEPVENLSVGGLPASAAVDAAGNLYVSQLSLVGGAVSAYNAAGEFEGTFDEGPATSVAADTAPRGDVVVDEGGQLSEFSPLGKEHLATFGAANLSGSIGIAIDPGGNLYATTAEATKVAEFGRFGLPPGPRIDNPAVVDSVSEPEVRDTADFQVSSNGRFAAFPSTLPLAGREEEPAGHTDAFRYDASTQQVACASCNPAGGASRTEASLAQDGLSLTEDGRVFFSTGDALSLSDTDNRRDVYEWAQAGAGNCEKSSAFYSVYTGACVSLISAGTSTFDSGLLGVNSNGKDAYFFTRDSLVPSDLNGPTVKIYDAREGGGFPFEFPRVSCKASDECHGASSPAPGPLSIGTEAGSPHNLAEECRRGFIRKHGHCVGKHHHQQHRGRYHKQTRHRGGGRR